MQENLQITAVYKFPARRHLVAQINPRWKGRLRVGGLAAFAALHRSPVQDA